MEELDWTDAEYEVIEDLRPVPVSRWTFWEDDFPNLFGIVCALLAAAFTASLFGYGPP